MYNFINKNKEEFSDSEDGDEIETKKNTETEKNDKSLVSSSDKSEIVVPDSFLFPGYMAFYLWGPFANSKDRLFCLNYKMPPRMLLL